MRQPNRKRKVSCISLSEEAWAALDAIAERTGHNRSRLVDIAVKEFLDQAVMGSSIGRVKLPHMKHPELAPAPPPKPAVDKKKKKAEEVKEIMEELEALQGLAG